MKHIPAIALSEAVDVNVHLSRWPFRRLLLDETPALVSKLRGLGIRQAWAASFDALLHRDMGAVNARLDEACKKDGGGMLTPFGSVNPMLPDWEEDLRRCRDVFHMPGIRLYPNYHGYKLDRPEFARLLELATAAGLLVQIAVSMEDDRTQHPLVRVPAVDVMPLQALVSKFPKCHIMLLNALRAPRSSMLSALAKIDQIFFDIATLETVGGVSIVLEQLPAERILFGSHAPFYYPESAALKMTESPLQPDAVTKILSGNAARLLSPR